MNEENFHKFVLAKKSFCMRGARCYSYRYRYSTVDDEERGGTG